MFREFTKVLDIAANRVETAPPELTSGCASHTTVPFGSSGQAKRASYTAVPATGGQAIKLWRYFFVVGEHGLITSLD